MTTNDSVRDVPNLAAVFTALKSDGTVSETDFLKAVESASVEELTALRDMLADKNGSEVSATEAVLVDAELTVDPAADEAARLALEAVALETATEAPPYDMGSDFSATAFTSLLASEGETIAPEIAAEAAMEAAALPTFPKMDGGKVAETVIEEEVTPSVITATAVTDTTVLDASTSALLLAAEKVLRNKSGEWVLDANKHGSAATHPSLSYIYGGGTAPTGIRSVKSYTSSATLNAKQVSNAFGSPLKGGYFGLSDDAKLKSTTSATTSTDLAHSVKLGQALFSLYSGHAFGSTLPTSTGAAPVVLTSLDAPATDAEILALLEPVAEVAPVIEAPKVSLKGVDYKLPRTRPNGELYFPRTLKTAGKAGDEAKLDTQIIHQAYLAGIPVLLYGEPGTGKTAAAEAILDGMITLSGTADTEVGDFLGSYVQLPDGNFEWVDGPLVRAMELGVPFLIDEVALIDSRVMAVVYSVMDGRGELNVTANPKRDKVIAQPGFYVIGACNPDVPGAVMSEALLSRFTLQFEYTSDYSLLQRKMGVPSDIVSVARNLAKQVALGEVQKAPQTRELLAFKKISEALGQDVALSAFVSAALPRDRMAYQAALNSTFGQEIPALATKGN